MRHEIIERSVTEAILTDLDTKMVLLAGPRQCGKSTLAQTMLENIPGVLYNWDIEADRKALLKYQLDHQATMWVFDELHKFRRWKNWLKGVFDQHHHFHPILVTGSARLNIFKKGGDSLQGRYFFHRLHPFTYGELLGLQAPDSLAALQERLENSFDMQSEAHDVLDTLLHCGGFPEPFLKGSLRSARRWQNSYGQRLVQEDLRQLHEVRELSRLELLYDRLPEIASAPVTIKRLAFDLEVAFESVKFWLTVFENLYTCFRLPPFGLPRVQAVKKQQKLFLWDWARIEEPGPRLENMIALHLLRLIHWAEDVWGERLELRYYRDQQGHEVDFLILRKRLPWMAVEVKSIQQEVDRGLSYFLARTPVPLAFQVHLKGQERKLIKTSAGNKVRSLPVSNFLAALP